MLAARAGGVLAGLEELEADLAREAGEVRGVVRVAAFQTATRALVMPALERLAAEHPALRVELTELEAEESLPLLARGGVDIAVAEEYEHAPRPHLAELHRDELEADELLLTLPRDHALAGHDGPVRLGSLRGEAWATARAGTHYADMFVRTCRIAGGFEPDIHHRVNDIQMLLDLVAVSGAAALLPSLGPAGGGPARARAAAGRGPVHARAVRGHAGGRSRAALDGRRGRRDSRQRRLPHGRGLAARQGFAARPCARRRCSARRHSAANDRKSATDDVGSEASAAGRHAADAGRVAPDGRRSGARRRRPVAAAGARAGARDRRPAARHPAADARAHADAARRGHAGPGPGADPRAVRRGHRDRPVGAGGHARRPLAAATGCADGGADRGAGGPGGAP